MFKLNLRLMMHNDSLFIGLVAGITLGWGGGGGGVTCHKEDGGQRSVVGFFSRLRLRRRGHASRPSDAMQLLPWP